MTTHNSAQTAEVLAAMLSDVLQEQVSPSNPNARLVEDHGAESMDFVDIAERLETQFEVEVPNDEIEAFKTFGDLLTFIERSRTATS